jgi:diguanylate cyclase (GGDEF)-like protein/PAS domain S-box-containing protein
VFGKTARLPPGNAALQEAQGVLTSLQMDPLRLKSQKGIVYLCAATMSVVSLAVLFGWVEDIGALKTVLPGYPEMKPAGAGGFLLLALGLVLSVQDDNDRRFRWAPIAIGGIVIAAGTVVLGAYIFHFSSPINSALVPNLDPASTASRVSPISAFSFIFIGISLALARSRRFSQASGTLVVLALIATYAAILGHLYHADTFYGFAGINGMPLHTAFLFIVTGIGLLWSNREFRLIRLITSNSLGGSAARRLIPFVILIPTLIGWLGVVGQDHGLYDTGFGSSVSTFTLVVLILVTVLIYSRTMDSADEKRRIAEAELAEKEMRYRELFDYSQGLICIHDLDGRLTTVNRASLQLLGFGQEEMLGRNLRDFVPAERHSEFDAYLRKVTNEGLADGLLELQSKTGKRVVLRYYNVLATEEGKEPYVLGHAQDVTELLEAQQQLRELSLKDELTGLYNRRGFLTMAEHQLKLEKHSGTARGLALMFADMDGLKAINDTYGHEAGSHAIKTLGRLISSMVRSADLVARWGGDEFVILSVGVHDENAQLMVDRILERIDEHNAESREPYLIACSIGVAPIVDNRPLEEIIAKADEAMYAEKKHRKAAARGDIVDQPASFIRPWTGHSSTF